MAVTIRLRRIGSNKRPFFRIVAADERCATGGRFLEVLGWYDPKKKGRNFELDLARVDYWAGVGARCSDTVRSFVRKLRAGGAAESAAAPAETAAV